MSKLYREAILDANAIKETALENARDLLQEEFNPRVKSIISKAIQREVEGEDELELDLDDAEEPVAEEDELVGDEEELDLDEIFSYLNEDEEEFDVDAVEDELQVEEDEELPVDVAGEEDLDDDVLEIFARLEEEAEGEYEDTEDVDAFLESLREDDEEAWEEGDDEAVYEFLIREFGASDTGKPSEDDEVSVSGPYDTETDDLEDAGLYVDGDEYDEGFEDGDNKQAGLHATLGENFNLDALLREIEAEEGGEEDLYDELDELRRQNITLKKRVAENNKALKFLKKQLSEINLINSKLLYTTRLMKRFNLSEAQKLRIVEAFDRTTNVREAKLIYATLSEQFTTKKSQVSSQKPKVSGSKKSIAEATVRSLEASKKVNKKNTQPSDKSILSESESYKERFKKLANIKK